MPSSRLLQAVGVLALTAALLFPAACKKAVTPPSPTPDAGIDAGNTDNPDGGGDFDAGPPKITCFFDDDCLANQRCLLSGDTSDESKLNTCVAAMPCQTDEATCLDDSSTQYDYTYCIDNPRKCRCVLSDAAKDVDPRMNGFCKRPHNACQPCTADEQCGNSAFFANDLRNEAWCVQPDTNDPSKYCLERYSDPTKCGCGTSYTVATREDKTLFCVPQNEGGGICSSGGEFTCCSSDYVDGSTAAQCPPEHPICNRSSGICLDACHYDYETKTTIGCRSDLVCHVNAKHLKEGDLAFGSGSCGKPCTEDADCAKYSTGTTILYGCRAEEGSQKRCRPVGCLDDKECPNTPDTVNFNSYCEKGSLTCICDPTVPEGPCYCRGVHQDGTDWTSPSGLPYKDDCKPGYKCSKGGDTVNSCIKKNCVEEGGARVECPYGDFCCGEDRNWDGDPGNDICNMNTTGTELADYGKCYMAPTDIWCSSCASDDDCTDPKFPTKDPNRPPLDINKCYAGVTDRCLIACDKSVECPNGFRCGYWEEMCLKDGTPDCNGHPEKCTDNCQKQQDGSYVCRCACTTPFSTTECAPGERCANGGGYCVYGMFCLERVVDPMAGTYECDDMLAAPPPDAGTP